MQQKIIYSVILRKKHTILTEYTDCSGNFSQITIKIMDEIINKKADEPYKYKAKFFYGKYIFYILKDNTIYILSMIKSPKVKLDNDTIFYSFLYNIHDDISKKINFEKPGKLHAYSLSSYSNDLKSKITEINNGNINFSNKLIDKQKAVNKFESLDNKAFDEFKQFPILSNEQVHSDNNLAKEADLDNTTETVDSFNDDIMKSALIAYPDNDPSSIAINDIDDNFLRMATYKSGLEIREKNKSKINVKILIPIIIIFIIIMILVFLDIFVFQIFFHI